MKKTLIKACVLVLMVFSVSNLLKQPTEPTQIREVIVIKIPIPVIEVTGPHVIIVDNSDMLYEDIDVFCLSLIHI